MEGLLDEGCSLDLAKSWSEFKNKNATPNPKFIHNSRSRLLAKTA